VPRGQPDYGLYTQTPVASGISDPGEAAARLGSINVYDRRGWTVWMDDFEGPLLKWAAYSDVGQVNPVLSTQESWMGSQSVRFDTTLIADKKVWLSRSFPLTRLGKVGIEAFFLLNTRTPGYQRFRVSIYDGVNIPTGDLYLDWQAKTATIVTTDGDKVVMTKCFNDGPIRTWMPVKLVVDMDTDLYTRLIIGPQEVDLSMYHMVSAGLSSDKVLWVSISLNSSNIAAHWSYIDNFILTQNEP